MNWELKWLYKHLLNNARRIESLKSLVDPQCYIIREWIGGFCYDIAYLKPNE